MKRSHPLPLPPSRRRQGRHLVRAEIETVSSVLDSPRLSYTIFLVLVGSTYNPLLVVWERELCSVASQPPVVAPIGALLNGTCCKAYNLSGKRADPLDHRSVSRTPRATVVGRVFVGVAVPSRAADDAAVLGRALQISAPPSALSPSYLGFCSLPGALFFFCPREFAFLPLLCVHLRSMALNYALLLTSFFFSSVLLQVRTVFPPFPLPPTHYSSL